MKPIRIHSSVNREQAFLRPCLLALLVLFCSLPAWANKPESVKKKEFSKSFNATKNDNVNIDNRFGNINISYWNKNEVYIQVVVEAKARNEERALSSINRVNIEMSKTGNTISAVTSLREQNINNGSNESFSINYYIQMPSGISCDLTQKYGNIIMPESNKGKCVLQVKYGNIQAGSFDKHLEIEAQYGNVDLKSVNTANLDLSYCGNASLTNASTLSIDCKYSGITIQKVNKLEMDTKYGSFDIEEVNQANIDVKYNQGTIHLLKESLYLDELSYSTVNIKDVSPKFKSIYADSHYGNLNIDIPNVSFRVNAYGMKYGKYDIKGFNLVASKIEDKVNHKSEVNGGNNGYIEFEGNNYGNLKIRER